MASAPVRIQWDPERSLTLEKLPWRSIQVGLSGEAVQLYVTEWIVAIRDVTPVARAIGAAVARGDLSAAGALLPHEAPLPLPAAVRRTIGLPD